MPTKRTRRAHGRRCEMTDLERNTLLYGYQDGSGGMCGWFAYYEYAERLWRNAGAELLPEWIQEHPGTRPDAWWRFNAPKPENVPADTPEWVLKDGCDPRRIVSGRGTVLQEEYPAVMPAYDRGIPKYWAERDDDLYVESEATYLQRHGLLDADELKRVKPEDFEPVQVECYEDESR